MIREASFGFCGSAPGFRFIVFSSANRHLLRWKML